MDNNDADRQAKLSLIADGFSASPEQLKEAVASGMDPTDFAVALSHGGAAELKAREIMRATNGWDESRSGPIEATARQVADAPNAWRR